jgi:hypothetical protein
MKLRIVRWLLGFSLMSVLTGVYTPPTASAAETHIAVSIGHTHHHHYRGHYVVYYRHGRRYRVYRHY